MAGRTWILSSMIAALIGLCLMAWRLSAVAEAGETSGVAPMSVVGSGDPIEQANHAAASARLQQAVVIAESLGAEEGTYASLETASLRAADPTLDASVVVAFAGDSGYCIQAGSGTIVVAFRRPGAAPHRRPLHLTRPASRRRPGRYTANAVAGSSNGRTPDSGSGSQGSNPCPAASEKPAQAGFGQRIRPGLCASAHWCPISAPEDRGRPLPRQNLSLRSRGPVPAPEHRRRHPAGAVRRRTRRARPQVRAGWPPAPGVTNGRGGASAPPHPFNLARLAPRSPRALTPRNRPPRRRAC